MKKLLFFFMSIFTITSYGQFFEGFEGTVFPPTNWARFDNGIGTLRQWNSTSSASLVYAGSKAAFMDRENVTDGTTSLDWLVTPQILVPTNGQLRFYTKKTQSGIFGSTYTIRVSTTTQNTPSDFQVVQSWTEDNLVTTFNQYEQKVIDLAAFVGQNVFIAFVLEQDNGDRWLVDQVKVDQRCQTPTNIQIAPQATTAEVSWSSVDTDGPWQIEYGPAGFIPGTGTVVDVTTNPYTITGLSSITNYSVIMRTICEPDNTSIWTALPISFQTSSLPPECNGNFIDDGGVAGNYSLNQDYVVTICPENVGDFVTVTFSQFSTEASYDKMYVYDGNSTAAPLISSGNGGGLGPVQLPGGFWGNLNANLPGPFEATSTSGCLTFRFVSDNAITGAGWVSSIVCAPFPTCPKPTNITSTVNSTSSITVNWTNNATAATSWEVIYLPAGSPPPTPTQTGEITTVPPPYTINNLESQTTYDIYVRAICTGNDVGPWSTVKTTNTTRPDYCGGDHFYDLGGPNGNYPNNVTATNGGVTTICPENPGDVITVYFNSFNLVSSLGDTLTIFDGNTTTSVQVGTYFGPNVIQSYTSTSASGCLTFQFVSNGTLNAPGWDATILCGPPCPDITAVLDNVVPAASANNAVRICQGESVTFTGSGTFEADGTGATYEWDFDDGTTATGTTATHAFANEGVYLVNLTIIDANGCRNTNRLNQKIYVSTTPLFTGTEAYDDEICLGQTTSITGAATPVEFKRECAPPVSGTTYLPDGAGNSYQSNVPVDCFPFGTTLASATQITSVCVNMEHSYLGDLELRLVSPNGQFIILKAFNGTGGGGGGTYLGCPIDGFGAADEAAGPGTGRNYCFTPGATTFLVNGTTSNCGTPSSGSIVAGNYRPVNPFANLIGSQLNGNWSLIVTDNLGIDNGYIFDWSITFDNSILPTDYSFTPVIQNAYWSPDPTIVGTVGQTIVVNPTATGTKCYTYNVVDDFGCTYSEEVCIEVTPGVQLDDITSNGTICSGGDGVFTFEGSPNTTVTYTVNGGTAQTVTLDSTGIGTVTLPGLTAATTVTASHITAFPIPTSGFAVTATGGVNPNNATGQIVAVGTTATTANSATINGTNTSVVLAFANELPPNTNVIVSLTRSNNAGSVTISDGVNSMVFNNTLFPGATNTLQHITFVTGTFTTSITVTRNNGNTFLDGASYSYNELGCDAPASLTETVQIVTSVALTSLTSNSPICSGETATFTLVGTPNAVVTYTINGGTATTVTLDDSGNGVVSVPNATADTVIGLSNITLDTCTADLTNTTTVTVNAAPDVTSVTNPSSICGGIDAVFTLEGNPNSVVTYTLNNGTAQTVTLDANGDATITVTAPTAAVTLHVTGAVIGTCTKTLDITKTIEVVSSISFTSLTSNSPICAGDDATFTLVGTPNAVVTYTLDGGAATTVTLDATGSATVTVSSPTADVVLLLSKIEIAGCETVLTNTTTVSVSPNPGVTSLVLTDSQICGGSDAVFTITGVANTIVSYSTDGGTTQQLVTLDASGSATITIVTPITNVTLTITGASLGTCVTIANFSETVFVNPLPLLTSLTSNSPICANETATFTLVGTPNGVVSYTLDGGAETTVTLDATGNATVSVSNATADVVIALTGITIGECATLLTQTETVTVNPNPDVTGLTVDNAEVCTGNDAVFNITGVAGTIVSYSTDGGTTQQLVTLDATGNATITVTAPAADVTLSITGASLGSCVTIVNLSATVAVKVVPLVTSLTSNSPICANEIATFTIEGTPNAVVSYTLNGGAETTITLDASGSATVSFSSATTNQQLALTGITLGNCATLVTQTETITVNPNPDVTGLTVDNAEVCAGNDAVFTITGVAGTIVSYSTNSGTTQQTVTLDASGNAIVTVTAPAAAVTLSISGASLGSCVTILNLSATVAVKVVPLVTSLTSNSPICANQTATFTIVGTPNSVVSYTLNGGTETTVTLDASGNATVSVASATANQQLALTGITLGNCASLVTQTATVTVNPNPGVSGLTAAASAICAGSNAVFTITGVAGSVVSYTINGGAVQTTTLNASGSATVTVTNPTSNVAITLSGAVLGSCSVASTLSATVQVNALPSVTSVTSVSPICAGIAAVFTINGTAGATVTYSINNGAGATVTLNASGTATVTLANASANVQITLASVTLNSCSASVTTTNTVTVNPNPVAPTVTSALNSACIGTDLAFVITGAANAIVTYSINNGTPQTVTLNASGNATISVPSASVTTTIDLESISNGFCSTSISVSKEIIVQSCAIQKGISPNNDGLNDNFQLESYNVAKLEIFNRYGSKVYDKVNYENEWYGQSNNGNELPDGTYYFVITFKDIETKTGWIYINREQ